MPDSSHLEYQQPTDQQMTDAAVIVRRFSELWDRPVVECFRAPTHEDARNRIPLMTELTHGVNVKEQFPEILKRVPGMRLDVVRWAPVGDIVMIEWAARATVGGRLLRWSGIDKIAVRDGRIYEAEVYGDTRGIAERAAEASQFRDSHRKALAEIYYNLWNLL